MEEEKIGYYKEFIVNIIMGIENLDFLIYLHRLISRIVKEG